MVAFSLDVRELLAAAWHVSISSVTRVASYDWLPSTTWPAYRDREGGGGDGMVTRLNYGVMYFNNFLLCVPQRSTSQLIFLGPPFLPLVPFVSKECFYFSNLEKHQSRQMVLLI